MIKQPSSAKMSLANFEKENKIVEDDSLYNIEEVYNKLKKTDNC